VNSTGSTAPRMMTIMPERDMRAPVDRPGCEIQTYTFGPRTVRVHRC
jgi:hypothetical protein